MASQMIALMGNVRFAAKPPRARTRVCVKSKT